jgi:hypothetical protein
MPTQEPATLSGKHANARQARIQQLAQSFDRRVAGEKHRFTRDDGGLLGLLVQPVVLLDGFALLV